MSVELNQKYSDISQSTAEHLAQIYGGRAWEVLNLDNEHKLLLDDHPYLQAEVKYACREYACTIEDILSRRTRLAFLNRDAALNCIGTVANIMAEELGWTKRVKQQHVEAATRYIESYGGGGGDGKVYHQMKETTSSAATTSAEQLVENHRAAA